MLVVHELNRVPLHFEVGQLCGFEFVVQVASRVLVDARNLSADDGGPAFDAADENVLVTDAEGPHEESDQDLRLHVHDKGSIIFVQVVGEA